MTNALLTPGKYGSSSLASGKKRSPEKRTIHLTEQGEERDYCVDLAGGCLLKRNEKYSRGGGKLGKLLPFSLGKGNIGTREIIKDARGKRRWGCFMEGKEGSCRERTFLGDVSFRKWGRKKAGQGSVLFEFKKWKKF